MTTTNYISLSQEQIDKVGNALIYFAKEIPELYKTKALKLIYLLDELSIKRSGIPFFNLKYKVWQHGPVSEELFIDFSSDYLSMFDRFLSFKFNSLGRILEARIEFEDDEFSESDIKLLKEVCQTYGRLSAAELVDYTHRENTPWYKTASANNVLKLLSSEDKGTNKTEYIVNIEDVIAHDARKLSIYNSYQELHQ